MCSHPSLKGPGSAELLANLMTRDLGVMIDPLKLERLIIKKWSSVSALAHSIHETSALRVLRERRDELKAKLAEIEKQLGGE